MKQEQHVIQIHLQMPWCPDQNVVRVVDEFFEVLTLATRRLVKFYPAVCNLQDSELRKGM